MGLTLSYRKGGVILTLWGRSRTILRHRYRTATSLVSAARSWSCSRSSRQAQSLSGFNSASASRFLLFRCKHGRTSCLPWLLALGTMPRAMRAYWTSCEFSLKRSQRAAKSPCLYVDRNIAARLCFSLGFSLWWDRPRIISNSVMTGRRSCAKNVGVACRQR